MGEAQNVERPVPLVCPHCNEEIEPTASNLRAASGPLHKKNTMTCPACREVFGLDPVPRQDRREYPPSDDVDTLVD